MRFWSIARVVLFNCSLAAAAFAQDPAPAPAPPAGAPAEPAPSAAPAPGDAPAGDKKPAEAADDPSKKKPPEGDQAGAQPTAPPAEATPPEATPTPPPEAPPPAPPPAAPPPPAPTPSPETGVAPMTAPGAAPTADKGADAAAAKRPPPEMTLGIALEAGPNVRLDSTDTFTNNAPVGLTYGLGAWFAPSRVFSIGLAAQHIGLGFDRTAPIGSSYEVERSLTALWLGGRAYPLRSDSVGLFVQLQLGMSWQSVRAVGALSSSDGISPPHRFDCSASEGPGVGLGGGLGMDVDLDRHLTFIAQGDLTAQRMASDPSDLGGCAPGAGSETNLGARIGFMYRFDLDQKSSSHARRAPGTLTF